MTSSSPGAVVTRAATTVLLVTIFARAGIDAQGGGGVAGTVRDAAGGRLAGVLITLLGTLNLEARTDDQGRFVIEPLPDGEYVLTATLEGFAPSTRAVRVVDGQTAIVSVTLSIQILDEVVVTADKAGERDLQKVPLAVSVLTDERLQQIEAHTLAQLAGLAPSVTYSQNIDFAQLTIRGVGSNTVFAGSDPSSAVYLDGVYLARPAGVLGDFLDLERVEILRGPQGTLYGRNVVGGAINLVTKLPTNERTLNARLVGGSLRSARAEVSLSGPIVPGRIMASGSVVRGVSDGFVQDLNHPMKSPGGTDVTATRGTLRIVLNRRTELRVAADFAHRNPVPLVYKVLAVKPGFTVDNPPDLHQVRTSAPARSRHVHYGGSAQFIWRPVASTVFTSLFAARQLDYALDVDADITELNLAWANLSESHHQISQEFTVTSQRSQLTWTGGLFLFTDTDRQGTINESIAAGLVNRLNPTVKARTIAAFGQATVALGSRVSGIVGLRSSHDVKTMDNIGVSEIGDTVVSRFQYVDSTAATAWMPKVGVNVFDDQTLGYISATRGFKNGGFNPSAPSAGRGFAPEWAWTYEVGFKSSALNKRVALNAAAYFTDYSDLQVQTPVRPGVFEITNAATATIRGVELEAQAQAATGWRVGGHVAWLDARYDRYMAVGPGGASVDVAGRRLSNAPEWSGRTWMEYATDMGAIGVVLLYLDAIAQSSVYFTPLNDTIQRQGPYALVNANITIRPRQHWSVGFYSRNLTAADYLTGTSSVPAPAIGGRPGPPRQIGVQFTISK